MTELERLQKDIDSCNHKGGCPSGVAGNVYCEYPDDTSKCPKLKAHAERIAYCREHNMPIEQW